jgi:hypothetical protein
MPADVGGLVRFKGGLRQTNLRVASNPPQEQEEYRFLFGSRRRSELTTAARSRLKMTIEEYNVKCQLLRAACPLLEPHVLLYDTGWQLLGYVGDTANEPLVSICDEKSFPRAEAKYRKAYRRLVGGGMV